MALTPTDWQKRALFLGEPKIAGLDGANVQPAIYRPDSRFTGITDGLQLASTSGADVVGATDQAGITGPKTLYPSLWKDPEGLRKTLREQEFADVRESGTDVEIPGIGWVWKSGAGRYLKLEGNDQTSLFATDENDDFIDITDEVRAAQGEEVSAMDICEDVSTQPPEVVAPDRIAPLADEE